MILPSFTAAAAALFSFTASTPAVLSARSIASSSPLLYNYAYNNITYLGAPNAAFLWDPSASPAPGNQFYNDTVALSAGIRLIQARVHNPNDILGLRHTSCSLLDAISLTPINVTPLSAFSCTLKRPASLATTNPTAAIAAGHLPLPYHFANTLRLPGIEVPGVADIATTYSPVTNTTSAEATKCASPVFDSVDFWNVANPLAFVDRVNGNISSRSSIYQAVLTATTSGARCIPHAGPARLAALALAVLAGWNFLLL